MIYADPGDSFAEWREAARGLLARGVRPDEVVWSGGGQAGLFGNAAADDDAAPCGTFRVPAEFLKLARAVACYESVERWGLLYRLLYRIAGGRRHLLEIESDEDMRCARLMEKAVNRDVHKFHAFVRFREIEVEGEKVFAAWHEPQHFTVEKAVPFFVRRFGDMRFSIFTPKLCAHWDLEELKFSPGVERVALADDTTEDFWLTYYRAIFNPFRLKVGAMKKEMPVRHWRTLPEARLINELIEEAGRV
ncbi:MAG: TIGR03915 family putative DNA repair protein [Blastocatellia bacterium]|nr:TIGR03915 family putative DNA repair protein [Blastocatellia bacterium]